MSDSDAVNVVLCWHMHQPSYADSGNGVYHLPWTYLHAIKDYTDMAAHLEAQPKARVVVNFAPILLEQISDYSQQIAAFLQAGTEINDPLLAALAAEALPADFNRRRQLVTQCMRINADKPVHRFVELKRLLELSKWYKSCQVDPHYINDLFIMDLLV